MYTVQTHLSFWFALVIALIGATLASVIAGIPGGVGQETLRPMALAGSLLALATAASYLYGGSETEETAAVPDTAKSAFWTVSGLSLLALIVPVLVRL